MFDFVRSKQKQEGVGGVVFKRQSSDIVGWKTPFEKIKQSKKCCLWKVDSLYEFDKKRPMLAKKKEGKTNINK